MKLFSNFYFRCFAAGFTLGFLCSVLYLLTEGSPVFKPLKDYILLYPGVVSGVWFYDDVCSNESVAEAFGCVVNGLSYGVIFLLPAFLIRKLRKSK